MSCNSYCLGYSESRVIEIQQMWKWSGGQKWLIVGGSRNIWIKRTNRQLCNERWL